MTDLSKELERLRGELAAARAEITRLSKDCVSGLMTRQRFEDHLAVVGNSRRDDGPFGIIMVDIDHFKQVNDKFGHPVGDEVISHVAQTIEASTRRTDLVARYGGEEFVVVVPSASIRMVCHLAERIRANVEALEIPNCPKVTVSVGFSISGTKRDANNAWYVVERADAGLYRAKRLGRNRVENTLLSYGAIQFIADRSRHALARKHEESV